jgi:DNA polymerase-3 subunit alpha
VNRSEATFKVRQGVLHYALGALKNVGVEAMKLIVEGRGDKPFATLYDMARRVDLKRIGKRPLEMLARAGAFDVLDRNRRRVFESIDALTSYSAAIFDQKASNQVSLFGDAGEDLPEPRLVPVEDWLPAERLTEEFRAVGFYLSGHPLDDYMAVLRRQDVKTLDEVLARAERGPFLAKMAGVVAGRQERKSARGNRFAFAQLSDPTGGFEVTLFSEVLEASRDFLDAGAQVVIQAEATLEADQLKLLCRSVQPVDGMVADAGAVGLCVFVDQPEAIDSVAAVLDGAAKSARGARPGPIRFRLLGEGLPGEVEIDSGAQYPVNPQIKGAIQSLTGVVMVEEI